MERFEDVLYAIAQRHFLDRIAHYRLHTFFESHVLRSDCSSAEQILQALSEFGGPTDQPLEEHTIMPEKSTLARARRDKRQGKAASTQAGEFVREEIEHIRRGKHGARSARQAIAIGLSKARRAGVKLRRQRAAAKVR